MNETSKPFGISGSTLKLIAILSMLIDHTGATVLRSILNLPAVVSDPASKALWSSIYSCSRSIGRLAFPIFCFFIVEGFLHTRNVWNYAGRLFLFALISEVPFDRALKGSWFFPGKQNVYFTLLIGLLVLICIDYLTEHLSRRILLSVFPIAIGMVTALRLNTDYNYKGVFLIAILYLLHQNNVFQCAGGMAATAWELPASASFIPIYFYNGTRGRQMKFFFYWFYPVHLMILWTLSVFLIPYFNH